MRVAFDEHVAPRLADAIKALSGEGGFLRVEIVSARQYAPPKAESDVPWIRKFASEGGKVIISGDAKMRGKLHEQKALRDAGFIVIFFARKWNDLNAYAKAGMLIKWWPVVLRVIESAAPGQFFEIPCAWRGSALKEVTPPNRHKPGAKPKPPHAKAVEPQADDPEQSKQPALKLE